MFEVLKVKEKKGSYMLQKKVPISGRKEVFLQKRAKEETLKLSTFQHRENRVERKKEEVNCLLSLLSLKANMIKSAKS